MPEWNRRETLAAMAATGMLMTAMPAAADDDKKDEKKKAEFDASGDKRRVMAAGMTEAEADCWAATADAAGKFFNLPKLHAMDDHEVAHAIHVIQNKLLGRPVYRKYLELAKAEAKK